MESVEDTNTPSAHRREFKTEINQTEINLKMVNFMPLYAVPSSRPKALQCVIVSPTVNITLNLLELKQILRL
jgi:hypothetical protein